MDIQKTKLDGVLLIKPPTNFKDFRGCYVELFNEKLYRAAGIKVKFIQDDISMSHYHVLRGLHGDRKTWKLISCLYGKFYLAVVNCDRTSPQFRKWQAFTLSDQNRLQVLIPPRFANGHLVLSKITIFQYKQSSYYNRASQFTLAWNDPKLGIRWPVRNPIMSKRDETAEFLK